MELMSIFEKQGYQQISRGCYGMVYANSSSWIVKKAKNDGTRTYLEWCLTKTRRGERMKGMPELDFLADVGDAYYVVAMKRYNPINKRMNQFGWNEPEQQFNLLCDPGCPKHLKELIDAFHADCPSVKCNDVHSQNVMADGKTVILTDPSSDTYFPTGTTKVGYASEPETPVLEMTHY